MGTKTELLPCPFCGGSDVEIQNSFAGSKKPVCTDCGASLHPSRSNEAAINEWNTRVYPPEVQAAIERDKAEMPAWDTEMDEPLCPACHHKFKFRRDAFCQGCGQRMDWSEE